MGNTQVLLQGQPLAFAIAHDLKFTIRACEVFTPEELELCSGFANTE